MSQPHGHENGKASPATLRRTGPACYLGSRVEMAMVVEVAGELALRARHPESQPSEELKYLPGPDPNGVYEGARPTDPELREH